MALNENRLDVAERLLKPHLKDDPFDVAAIRMLAELAARIGRWARCREACSAARSSWRPASPPPGPIWRWCWGGLGRPAEALALLDDIFADESEDVGVTGTSRRRRSAGSAISRRRSGSTKACLQRAPNQPRVWLSYGHMLKTVGRQGEGVDRLSQGDRASSRRWARRGGALPI